MKIVHKMVINAIGISLVFISTAILNVTVGTSLVNLGDAFIFIIAYLFGPIAGLVAGSIGSCLADLAVFPITALYTFFIKGIEGLLFGLISNYIKNKNYKPIIENIMLMIACVTSCFIMMLGYFLTETFLYGSYQTALVSIYSNLVQSVLSIIIFYVLYNILKNIKLFKRKDL